MAFRQLGFLQIPFEQTILLVQSLSSLQASPQESGGVGVDVGLALAVELGELLGDPLGEPDGLSDGEPEGLSTAPKVKVNEHCWVGPAAAGLLDGAFGATVVCLN